MPYREELRLADTGVTAQQHVDVSSVCVREQAKSSAPAPHMPYYWPPYAHSYGPVTHAQNRMGTLQAHIFSRMG